MDGGYRMNSIALEFLKVFGFAQSEKKNRNALKHQRQKDEPSRNDNP